MPGVLLNRSTWFLVKDGEQIIWDSGQRGERHDRVGEFSFSPGLVWKEENGDQVCLLDYLLFLPPPEAPLQVQGGHDHAGKDLHTCKPLVPSVLSFAASAGLNVKCGLVPPPPERRLWQCKWTGRGQSQVLRLDRPHILSLH